MNSPVLRLDAEELWSAFAEINPIDVLAEELIGRNLDHEHDPQRLGRLTPWPPDPTARSKNGTHAPSAADAELVLLDDLQTRSSCVLPAAQLRMFRDAGLAALAARELIAPGVVTAAVLGSYQVAQPHLMVIAKHVPEVSHLAVFVAGEYADLPIEPRVREQLELAGISLSVTAGAEDAVFGANLIASASAERGHPAIGPLAKGALLINVAGHDLPAELVDSVSQIYVDDARLVAEHADRYFVRMHLAEESARQQRKRPERTAGRPRRITADLGAVLTRRHPGRTHIDDSILVELLSVGELDVPFACRLHSAARRHGLGVPLPK